MAERKLKKRADGRYMRRVKVGVDQLTGCPIREPVYGRTLAEVNEAVRDLREKKARGEIVVNKNTLVGDYATTWLEATISPNRKKSYDQYKRTINSQIKVRFPNIKISELRMTHIQKEITAIENEGKARTAVLFRMTMTRILDAALADDYVTRNYSSLTSKPAYDPPEKKPLSEAEIDLLMAADLLPMDKAFVVLCLWQGFRKSEALGLRRFTGDTIEVAQVWQCGSDNHPSMKAMPKTKAGHREIGIMPQTRQALDNIGHDRMYYFSNDDGSLLTSEQYKNMWRRIQTAFNVAAGGVSPMGMRKAVLVVRHFTSHYLRHTFCTLLYYAGFDLKQTQYIMGQNDSKVTLDVYTHLDKASLGKTDKYSKWHSLLREVFLNEKASKRRQIVKL